MLTSLCTAIVALSLRIPLLGLSAGLPVFDDYAELKAANLTYKQLLVRKLDYDTYDEAEARYTTYDALEASGLTYEQLTRKEDKT